ncbi:MAG: hypothetical protein CVV42_07695 [Candidatus Riflebacteria bacterium HGW-Riflebacteria-2]|jgi:hypothetical protein|nr:MAG: hypothetical protein CVV42_07695 [Candidatus Riflebacteria bacterium HGW-Riflebacteria-2]
MADESLVVWRHDGKVILHQTLIEDGLDMSTEVEIYLEHVAWVREALTAFVDNWQTQEQRHKSLDEEIDIFSAGNEMDPRVGIQSERAGKSFSMIVRMPLASRLIQLLSSKIPEAKARPPRPEQLENNQTQVSETDKLQQIEIKTTECRDPLGDTAETIEISCGEAKYWDWSPEKLLNQLTSLQHRLTAQKSEERKSEILLEDDSYLLPGESASEKEQTLTRMIVQLEKRFGKNRKKHRGR